MTPLQIVFLIIALATLISAGMVVSARRIMHAALWLVLTLFGVAALFATLETGFFAVVQLVIYVGAIAILIIFAVMLTRRDLQDTRQQTNRYAWASCPRRGGRDGRPDRCAVRLAEFQRCPRRAGDGCRF